MSPSLSVCLNHECVNVRPGRSPQAMTMGMAPLYRGLPIAIAIGMNDYKVAVRPTCAIINIIN